MRSPPLAGTPTSSRAGAVLDARAGRAAAVAGGLVGRLALGWADGMALLAVALWGLNFSITKGVVAQVPPLSGSLLRGTLTGLVYVALLLATGRWRLPRGRDLGRLLAAGLVGMTLNAALWVEGLRWTSASHAGLLPGIAPLVVYGMSHVLGAQRLSARDLLGLGLGLGGMVLIVGVPALSGEDSGGASLWGDLLSAGSAVAWGVATVLAAPLLRRYGTLAVTAWLTALSTCGLLPLAAPSLLGIAWGGLGWAFVGGLAYWALISGAVGGLLWYGAVRHIGAARTMIYANLQSFFALLFAALLLSERVEASALAGGLAVIGGVLLTRGRQDTAARHG